MLYLAVSSSSQDATNAAAAAIAGMGLFGLLFVFGIFVFSLVINWLIVSKAGYNGALSLLALVPLVNLVAIIIFAFSDWPVRRELALARSARGDWPGGPPPSGYGPPDLARLPSQP
jgi:apolipoprotein N-acyltransferase